MIKAGELMVESEQNPPKPIIEGLWNESEIVGLHGVPASFKTVSCLQLAEELATGKPFLGIWPIPQAREVYFLETEMSPDAIGKRLLKMFSPNKPPQKITFADKLELRAFKRAPNLDAKFALLREWFTEARAEVLIIDTCNPFFRGKESPNEETSVGKYFDLLEAMPVLGSLFVRHNHKRRLEDDDNEAAAKIRGSGQFADVPDLLLELRRRDKRTHEALLAVTKYRHGMTPDDLPVWFDRGICRLIAIPPVIHLLLKGQKSRTELLALLKSRFNLGHSTADAMIDEQLSVLCSRMDGHSKIFEIDWQAAKGADWITRVSLREKGELTEPSETPTLPPALATEAFDPTDIRSDSLRQAAAILPGNRELEAARQFSVS